MSFRWTLIKTVSIAIIFSFLLWTGLSCKNVFSGLPLIDNTPPADPELFTAVSGDGMVSLSWINPVDTDFSEVRIVKKTGDSPASPSDNGLLFSGSDIRYTDSDVTNGSPYYYTIFSCDKKGNCSAGVRANGTPAAGADATPPGNVTSIVKTAVSPTELRISWINPADTDFQGVKIMRSTQAHPASAGDGTELANGNITEYTDSGLTEGTNYYYTIFTYDEVPNYSTGAQVTIISTDMTPPGEVTGLKAEYLDTDKVIHFSWTNPTDPDFDTVIIIRKMNSPPDSNNDGTRLYSSGRYADDSPGVYRYYYRVYTRDKNGNYSTGVNAAILYKTPCKIPYLNLDCCADCK